MEQELNRQKPNPYNSTTVQALLDIKKAMLECDIELFDIDDILAELQKDKSTLRETADRISNRHRYPERAITFIQSGTYDQCPERFELTRPELVLLELMERLQSPEGYVTVKKGMFCEVLHFTDTERKSLQKYLDNLTKAGFLKCIYRPPIGSKKPGEYQINRSVSWIGKRPETNEKVKIKDFEAHYTRIRKEITLPDGSKAISGTLEEKKEVSAPNTDPDESQDSPNSPNSPDNCTQPPQKNQLDFELDPDLPFNDINMQNELMLEEDSILDLKGLSHEEG